LDLAGQSAAGATASRGFQPGTHTIQLTATDLIGAEATVVKTLTVKPSVTVSAVSKLTGPYRLKVKGSNFAAGCTVLIDGKPVPETACSSPSEVVAKKGEALKAMTPKGVAVAVVVGNPDGGQSLPFAFTR